MLDIVRGWGGARAGGGCLAHHLGQSVEFVGGSHGFGVKGAIGCKECRGSMWSPVLVEIVALEAQGQAAGKQGTTEGLEEGSSRGLAFTRWVEVVVCGIRCSCRTPELEILGCIGDGLQ